VSIINIIWGESKGKDNFTTETLAVPVLMGDGGDAGGMSSDEDASHINDGEAENDGAEQQV
jgi:hypothetical protein